MNAASFRTHTGETVTGQRLQDALNTVANDWAELGHLIRRSDEYAGHVTEGEKSRALREMLARAEAIRSGDIGSLTIWQRVNTELTGECIAILS